MKPKKGITKLSSFVLVILVAIVGIFLGVFWFGMSPATANYFQAVQDHGWSLPAVWVGAYGAVLWGGATFFALFQTAALKELKDRLFGP